MVCGRGPSIGKKFKEEIVDPVQDVWKEDIRPWASEALTAAGTAVGGPLGGAIGGAVGQAIEGGNRKEILGSAISGGVGGMISGGLGSAKEFLSAPFESISKSIPNLASLGNAGLEKLKAELARLPENDANSAIDALKSGATLDTEKPGFGLSDLISAYGTYRQGEMAQDAIRDSARLQHEAAMSGIDEQRAAREQMRQDLAPFAQFGSESLGPLSSAVRGEDFGRSEMIGGAGNPLLQQAVEETQAFDPMANLGPGILQNPLLQAMQADVTRRLMANQAARGKLGSGGTAEALQQRLVPQAIQFGQTLNQAQRQATLDRANLGGTMEDLRQRDVSNLFSAAQIGGNAAAQQGQAGLNVASNIGNLQQQAAGAQTFGALGQAANRGQQIGAFQNYLTQNFIPTVG